jgi:hypothetical protein
VHITDYHFMLSDRPDLTWPLSATFEKLVSNTTDRGKGRYTLPYVGLLTPGQKYYWRVRAKNDKGVWGPWSKTWNFTASGPAQPVDVRLEYPQGLKTTGVLRWNPNAVGRKAVKYRVYGSDEKGFSTNDAPYKVAVGRSKELPATFPANFVAETADTELVVLGQGLNLPNANKAFYRMLAIDAQGKRSGPSDYVAASRPFIYSAPTEAAKVGVEYKCKVSTVRSLGDLRMRIEDGKEVASFWDIENPRFTLVRGPSWLHIGETSGVLSGKPDATGTAEVVVLVSLGRPLRRVDEAWLSWGHEEVLTVGTEKVGSTTQRFQITVEK